MTIREAISGEIEPYGLSDDSLEKAYIDASGRFSDGVSFDIDTPYTYALKKVVAFAAMLCLNRVRELTAENIGGLSQNFDVKKLEKRIKAIATEAGISPDIVLADTDEPRVTFISI